MGYHGVDRIEYANGTISEATFNQGVWHGLRRFIEEDQVTFQLWMNGSKAFESKGNTDLIETSRFQNDSLEVGFLFMEEIYPMKFSNGEEPGVAVMNAILASPPVGLGESETFMWRRLTKMNDTIFGEYWNKTLTEEQLIDYEKARYEEWSEIDTR